MDNYKTCNEKAGEDIWSGDFLVRDKLTNLCRAADERDNPIYMGGYPFPVSYKGNTLIGVAISNAKAGDVVSFRSPSKHG